MDILRILHWCLILIYRIYRVLHLCGIVPLVVLLGVLKKISSSDFYSSLGLEKSNILNFKVLKRSSTNRILNLSINSTEFTGRELYDKLGLKSTDFSLKQDGDTIIIDTVGYGHGVGMSQYGAEGMALEGYSYKDILSHYYVGTSIKKLLN